MSRLDTIARRLAPSHRHAAQARIGLQWAPLVCVGLWAALGCGDSGNPRVSEGQALYQANCMACHGASALGDGPMASSLPVQPPSLLEHLGHHTQTQLIRLITGGIPPAMPPQPLTPDQVQLVVDYVWTLVPESEVAALRAMQQHMEMMGDSGMSSMPGMSGMPGMGRPDSTPPMGSMGMDHDGR